MFFPVSDMKSSSTCEAESVQSKVWDDEVEQPVARRKLWSDEVDSEAADEDLTSNMQQLTTLTHDPLEAKNEPATKPSAETQEIAKLRDQLKTIEWKLKYFGDVLDRFEVIFNNRLDKLEQRINTTLNSNNSNKRWKQDQWRKVAAANSAKANKEWNE